MAERNHTPDDEYDRDLERDNRRDRQRHTMADLANEAPADGRNAGTPAELTVGHDPSATDRGEYPQHARKGQAESPVEETHYEPPKHKGGHGTPKLDR